MPEEESCFRIRTKNGKNLGGVCIAPGKNVGKMDIILIKDNAARSMRSTTELVNTLLKDGADLETIDVTVTQIRKRMQPKVSLTKAQDREVNERGEKK